jgi:hypothetical protein
MDTTLKMTKQGIRDLNSYGPRPKVVAADGAAPPEGGTVAVDAPVSTPVEGTVTAVGPVVSSPDAASS